jgi:uncharacterized protein (TIRG00374 family)
MQSALSCQYSQAIWGTNISLFDSNSVKLSKLAWGYALIILIYIGTLLLVDSKNGFFEYSPIALPQLPALTLFALASFGFRYVRWFLLLGWSGNNVSFWRGWLAYLSGFAFTATPGKLGELVRIRYFGQLHVHGGRVMSAFVFERVLDLLVVFCLATLWVADSQMFAVALTFVGTFLIVVGFLIFKPKLLENLSDVFFTNGWNRVGQLLSFLSEAMAGCAVWFRPTPLLSSVLLGFASWCITALAFVYLLITLKLYVPTLEAFATYPLAILVGAASMLPGGVGSTEAAIVLQLQMQGISIGNALFVAVVIRLATIWFAVVCGFVSIVILEMNSNDSFHGVDK